MVGYDLIIRHFSQYLENSDQIQMRNLDLYGTVQSGCMKKAGRRMGQM